jgi:hypothetical protein
VRDIIDVDCTSTELARPHLGGLEVRDATDLMHRAAGIATEVRDIVQAKGLASRIQGRSFVRVEGWQAAAGLMGCNPTETLVERQEDGGYVATVEVRRSIDGFVVARASALCGMDESTWANRPEYARRSMAVTRATSKACRLAFGWIIALAGYETTPREEMPEDEPETPAPAPVPPATPEPPQNDTARLADAQARIAAVRAARAEVDPNEVPEDLLGDVDALHELMRQVDEKWGNVTITQVWLTVKDRAEQAGRKCGKTFIREQAKAVRDKLEAKP